MLDAGTVQKAILFLKSLVVVLFHRFLLLAFPSLTHLGVDGTKPHFPQVKSHTLISHLSLLVPLNLMSLETPHVTIGARTATQLSQSVIKTNTSPLANASFFQIGRVRVKICSPIGRVNNSPPLNIKIPTPNPLF